MNHSSFIFSASALMTLGAMPTDAQAAQQPKNQDKPNILWLTFEDTSAYEVGCYGNQAVHTPTIDSLAQMGVRFTNAWSVAPQSSPARSTLITGCCAPTFGMDLHPVQQLTPDEIFFPQALREAGYYCTNNFKTHYNTKIDNTLCWDECDKQASYNSPKREANQPFFAVFNSHTTHMGRVRTFHTDGRRDFTREGIRPLLLDLPEYLPDLPEMRSDYAAHLEAMQDCDTWVSTFLADLREQGLEEDTIVFVFSDHGGCLPRGKGYLYETGLQVPLVVYFPPKWQHLAKNLKPIEERLVSFVDLGPSVMSLAGVKPWKHMEGKALMGRYASNDKTEYLHAFGSNQLHHYLPVRAVRDARYKLMVSYVPYRQFALRNYYQWGMPANMAWDKWVLGGHNLNPLHAQPFEHHPAVQLFDLENDPWELHDLSGEEAYQETLERLKGELEDHLVRTHDLGFFLPSSRMGVNVYDKVHRDNYPLNELIEAAKLAAEPTSKDLTRLGELLHSNLIDLRFWGVVGCAQLALEGVEITPEMKACLQDLMDDADVYLAAEAQLACAFMGDKEGIEKMVVGRDDATKKVFYSSLECLSLDARYRDAIRPFIPRLKADAERLPARANEDAGLMAKGILVNLGEMTNFEIYGKDAYKRGLKFNYGRREMGPSFKVAK